MRINQIFAASMLASAVILSGTACEQPHPVPDRTTSATATASSSQEADSTNSSEDTAEILKTVNGYYDFITSPDSKEAIKSAAADLAGNQAGKQATDEELQTFADNFSEGFQYFDTSTSTSIKNAYRSMSIGSLSLAEQEGSVTISAPEESVTVYGDTATLNTTWISATINGKTLGTDPESSPDRSDLIQLVKKDDGSWVIVASSSSSLPKPTVP